MQQRKAADRGLLVEANSNIDDEKLAQLIKKTPIEDHYELERDCFARGKFAQVRRIRHKQTGEQFAAKTIKKRRARHGNVTDEIHHEIRVLLLAEECSGIVKLHDVFEGAQEFYLVLELAHGGELQQILDEDDVIEEQVCRRVMRQLVQGVHFLHRQNVAHLDIKPQNILLSEPLPAGEVRLCDFGISRIVADRLEIREIMGTTDYMAPETLNYDPISLATDMWSIGVVAYVLLSGCSPFAGESRIHTYSNITSLEIDFPDECFENVSESAKDFIRKLLVRDQRKRMDCVRALEHEWLLVDDETSTATTNMQSNIDLDLPLDCSTLEEIPSPEKETPTIIVISDLDERTDNMDENKENQPQANQKFGNHKRFSSEVYTTSEQQKLVAVISASSSLNNVHKHSEMHKEILSVAELSNGAKLIEQFSANVSSTSTRQTFALQEEKVSSSGSSDSNNNNVHTTNIREIPIMLDSRSFVRAKHHESSPPLTPNKKCHLSVDDHFAELVKQSSLFVAPLTRTRSVSMERLSCSSMGSSPTLGFSGPALFDSDNELHHSTIATHHSQRISSTSMSSLTCQFHESKSRESGHTQTTQNKSSVIF